ncbi:AAA family ATPase [Micromonospora sp. HUAS YX12]|uniref:Nuclease SbcCD subunit C n=1 Tax=Micromonospora sp. HUAS YX12 TaxID=3156396 RepID=A0AAU7R1M1_9ACTN
MSLKFESLSLKNFGPYRRIDNLDLATDPDAPVVVIHGENTLGKTQLFSALRWCLYGGLLPQQDSAQAMPYLERRFNNPARRDGESAMEVVLKFRVDDELYVLTRTARFADGPPRVSADLRIGPTVIPRLGIDAEIGKLLHPQISEFFLFDAELMQRFYDRLNTERERGFIRDSIETVLGIPALQRAEGDVTDLAQDALKRQAKAVQGAADAERINKRLAKIANEQASAEAERKELQEVFQRTENELRQVRDQLRVVEGLQADIREQETLEALITSGQQTEAKLREDMRQLLVDGWRAPLLRKLQAALERVQERNTAAIEQQRAVSDARTQVEVLRERLRGGICVACGQRLPAPDEATQEEFERAKARLARLESETGGRPDLELERKITSLVDRNTAERYGEKHAQLSDLLGLQYQRKRQIDQIKDRLQGNDAAAIRALGVRQSRLDDLAESTSRKLTLVGLKINANNVESQKLAKQLDRLPGANPSVVLEANFFGYVQTLLNRTIDRYRERTRAEVERAASSMFVRLVRDPSGYGGLRIARDYRVELLDTHNMSRETSEGGKQLVALSLIGALKAAAVRGGPVVLDSPLARLDLGHRANVLQTWIPSLGSQALLLVQSGELTVESARRILGSKLGQEYRIVRPNNDPEEAVIERTR